ncbi:hypothetical protein OG21DRAFT_113644 [Imleria badia]|nr:hypothetical protein OG21DRAFT_113644 [Imleria badia]
MLSQSHSMCDVCMERSCHHLWSHFCRAQVSQIFHDCFKENETDKMALDASTRCSLNVPFVATSSHPRISANSVWTATVHVQHLLDDIANTTNGATTLEEMQRVVNLCNVSYNAQPDTNYPSQHTLLGVSYLLLSTLLEAQRKLHSHADQLSGLAAARNSKQVSCAMVVFKY